MVDTLVSMSDYDTKFSDVGVVNFNTGLIIINK